MAIWQGDVSPTFVKSSILTLVSHIRCFCITPTFWFKFNAQAVKFVIMHLYEFQICLSPVRYLSDQQPPLPVCRQSPHSQMTNPPCSTAHRKSCLWTCKLWLLPQSGIGVDLNVCNTNTIIMHNLTSRGTIGYVVWVLNLFRRHFSC